MGDRLMVCYNKLQETGQQFISQADAMDSTLDQMKGQANFAQAWKDANGSQFNTDFGKFIEDAKKINSELRELGKFAIQKGQNYSSIESSHASAMGD